MGPITFEQPVWLLAILLVLPTFWLAWRSRGGQSVGRIVTAFGLRSAVIILLAMSLAEPNFVRTSDDVSVTVILDRSLSVPSSLQRESIDFLRAATDTDRRPQDRVAVITVARDSEINALASPVSEVDVQVDPRDRTATNLASAVELALATMPVDTANRFVVASDGNETMDSATEAAQLAAANGVPIDFLLLEYESDREVIFEEIVTMSRARVGQTTRVRMLLRSQSDTTGTLRLELNGTPIDLDPAAPGTGQRVELSAGMNAFEHLIPLERSGPYQFQGTFDPDDAAGDRIDENNTALAVTFVGGEGRVLIVDNDNGGESADLRRALEEAEIRVERASPSDWTGGAAFIGGFDCIILCNLPLHALERGQDELLHAYVHDLGGGLIMTGGEDGFGAGGWIDSATAKTLPVELNPPQTRQMLAGALALILHSCEMPQGNYWAQLVAESSIQALSRLDYFGAVEYQFMGGGAGVNQGNGWAHPMQRLGDKSAALAAIRQLQMGDMPSFEPSFTVAYGGLMGVNAAQRHMIIISDGDPQPPLPGTLQKFTAAGISVTTVMVGGHGTAQDRTKMQNIATQTGGTFYPITNPNQLPQVFFKEASLISRSLIQDGQRFETATAPGMPGPTAQFRAVPPVDGYVLTVAREGLAQTPIVIQTEEGDDPLYAFWNYGVGRSVAYTSGVSERWGGPWLSWGEFQAFWEQSVRWAMRPSAPADIEITTRIEGDDAIVELEAVDADASALNFMRLNAVVVAPDSDAVPLTMQQTGPGRYRGQFDAAKAGAYLLNIRHERPGAGDQPLVGTVQAAVTVPYSREFRSVTSNEALLRAIADRTGGRQLDPADPDVAALFDRETLETPRSPKPIWDFLAILAAALLVVDVAARRLSFDRDAVQSRLAAIFGRQSDGTAGARDAMRRVRDGSTTATQAVATKQDPSVAATRFTADEAGGPALDLDQATAAPSDPAAPRAPAKPTRPTPSVTDDADDDSMSRLLAAKRRARRDDDADGDGSGSGG